MTAVSSITPVVSDAPPVAQYSDTGSATLDSVSKDFESVFMSQMLEAMFSGDDTTAYFGGGTAGDVYKSTLLNEYGKAIANSGGIGIAAAVKQELMKLQEVGSSS